MVGPFALDGYDVLAPIGADGRRWRAVRHRDGRPVVLRRWIGAAARLAEVRQLAAVWGSLPGGGVVPVVDVVCDGADLVIVSAAGGAPLEVRLARCGRLSAGQVVTLVSGLAATLAAAHERELAHGRLDASCVLLDDAGRPLLGDYVFGRGGEPSVDVAALVAMASSCLEDRDAPAALVATLEEAVDAHDLALAVVATIAAEPLTAHYSAPPPPRTGTGTDARRGRIALAVTGAVAAAAVAVGAWWGRQDPAEGASMPPPPRPSASATPAVAAPAPTPTRWRDVVRRLERGRVHALATADVGALAAIEVPGTPLWRRDSRTVAHLATTRVHLRGLHVDVRTATVLSAAAARVVVRVVDALSSYDVVDRRGEVVEHRPGRPGRTVTLVLARHGDQWHIRAVSRPGR